MTLLFAIGVLGMLATFLYSAYQGLHGPVGQMGYWMVMNVTSLVAFYFALMGLLFSLV